jgi:Flp pilus assembly protein TadB
MSKVNRPLDRLPAEAGIAVALIGFLVAAIGAALAFTALPSVGHLIGVAGALCGLIGVALHFVINWRTIFHVRPKD